MYENTIFFPYFFLKKVSEIRIATKCVYSSLTIHCESIELNNAGLEFLVDNS